MNRTRFQKLGGKGGSLGWLENGSDGPSEGAAGSASWGQLPSWWHLELPSSPAPLHPTLSCGQTPTATPTPGLFHPWLSWAGCVLQRGKVPHPEAWGSNGTGHRPPFPTSTFTSSPLNSHPGSLWALGPHRRTQQARWLPLVLPL